MKVKGRDIEYDEFSSVYKKLVKSRMLKSTARYNFEETRNSFFKIAKNSDTVSVNLKNRKILAMLHLHEILQQQSGFSCGHASTEYLTINYLTLKEIESNNAVPNTEEYEKYDTQSFNELSTLEKKLEEVTLRERN